VQLASIVRRNRTNFIAAAAEWACGGPNAHLKLGSLSPNMNKHRKVGPVSQAPHRPSPSRPKLSKSAPPKARALQNLTGWRLWAARLGLGLAAPALLLVLAEWGLRLTGYGYPTRFVLRQSHAPFYVENYRFLWQFYSRKSNLHPNPFAVAVAKPAETVRIIVIGESAAAGTPEPAYNFGRILERMLRHRYPQKRIEVINAAMPGVNSHILLRVVEDCVRLHPDLFVVYMGNNEAVGLYAPGPRSGGLTPHLHLLRGLQRVRTTRLGQVIEPWVVRFQSEAAPAEAQNESFFLEHRVAADDLRRRAVYDNFRANLADLCHAAREANAPVALMTIPVNLRDCPPFGSLHRAGLSSEDLARWQAEYDAATQAEAAGLYTEAIVKYKRAATQDDHFAELHYRLARCYESAGEFDKARDEFISACDWDALQFRTDSKINGIIRQMADQFSNESVRLVDTARAFAASQAADHQAPGNRLFHDHVHLNLDGDYLLARTLFLEMTESLKSSLGTGANQDILSREECETRLAYTRINATEIASQMARTMALPPFTAQLGHAQRQKLTEQKLAEQTGSLSPGDFNAAIEAYRSAIRQYPEDWELAFLFGRLLLLKRDFPGAIEQFTAAKGLLPHYVAIRMGLSSALNSAGKRADALRELEEARALKPDSGAVQAAIRTLGGR
jgi:tetratricopeptide (TPR) repeat protein